MKSDHKFILPTGAPRKGLNTRAAFIIVDYYLKGISQSRNRWKKDTKDYNVNWTNLKGERTSSESINYLGIAEHLRKERRFFPEKFNLPPMECFWMDHSLDLKIDIHMSDHTGTLGIKSGVPQQQYGDNYPIDLNLQREGHLYTSFQRQLTHRIISERSRLIENSDSSLTDKWVFDLRSLVSDCISLLDITLNQLYIKAEYAPLPHWNFDKKKLGSRHGRRLVDKLKWIFQISQNRLNIEREKESLFSLRDLRNHLMHFDPPSLIITLEEANLWLNQIIDIGLILIKIREAIGAEVSSSLVNFILQEEVSFNPKNMGRNRSPFNSEFNDGYKKSTWNE